MGCLLLCQIPIQACSLVGDVSGDCQVNIDDLNLMALQWLDSGPVPANLDGLGEVNLADFVILAGDWGQTELTGSVTVTIAAPIPTGGQWRVDSGSWFDSGDTASGIAVGSHTITFADVAGFDKPADEPVTITNGETAVVNAGAYTQHTGTLVVNISPQGAVNDGAQWSVDAGSWNNSGTQLAQVVGVHTVQFSSVSGWQKPGSLQVEVFNNTQAVVNASYIPFSSIPLQITEFMADNDSRSTLGLLAPGDLLDGDLMSSDWIEIYNNSSSPIDISGKYLTDESNQKTKWQFPPGIPQLQPGAYLIVFASGKTQELYPANYPYWDGTYYHTNFKLDKGGEYLALIDTDGMTVIHEYDKYPDQRENFSYGLANDDASYFSTATPGEVNLDPFIAFVAKPDVSIAGGCYQNAIDVSLSCDTVDSFIRYTTDGTAPTLTHGTDYTGPIHINSLTGLVVKGFKTGFQPSKARIETYIFVQSGTSPSNTNLPIVVVDTIGQDIPNEKEGTPEQQYTDCRVVIIDVDNVTGRAEITGPEHFAGIGQIKRRGESTYGQGHYGLEIVDEYGQDDDVSLLDMPAESDWILSYDVIDYSMMKNEIAFKWFRDMGHYAPRQRYVEVYLNTNGGAISSSDYKGLYMLREKIKRSENRVDIARMDSLHNTEPQVSGGYIFKCDKPDPGDIIMNQQTLWESAYYGIGSGAGTGIISDPDSTVITNDQIDWAISYLNEVHSVFWQNTGSSYYPGSQFDYTDYVDAASWIDHGIVEQIGNDSDAFWGSYYTHKNCNGKVHSGPPWDFDRAFQNSGGSYGRAYDVWRTQGEIFGKWHQKLQEHLEYRINLADRWFEHRETVLNTAQTMNYIDQTIALIAEARSRPKKYYPNTFEVENQLFKDWITNRLYWLDGEIASRFAEKPPIISPVSGYIDLGSTVEMELPPFKSGDIYYTLNGEDPRMEGGGINPNAEFYPNPGGIVLEFEDFEAGMGNWSNVTGDSGDWTRKSGPTNTNYTGPDSGADESPWYMYIEATNFNNGDTVILEGPSVEGTGLKLSFFYHMHGWDMGTLNVDVDENSDGSWTNGVWSRSGEQHSDETTPYTQGIVDLSSYVTPLKVRFRGVATGGTRGDMAIDHIKITRPTDQRTITEPLVDMSSAVWKYLYDGSDQGTAWRTLGFYDSSWDSGPGQLGFGDGDETTDIGPKVNGRLTAYFRHRFSASNISEITDMSIDLLYDDGAVVYLNDQEVGRVNMPAGTINFDTTASQQGENSAITWSGLDPAILNEGDNVLSVEVHQERVNSSDISFDLRLKGTRTFSGFNKSTCVKARIKDGSDWSAMNTELYAVGPVLENLRITELMYHPTDPTPAEIAALDPDPIAEDFEFIELKNVGTEPINLNLVYFTDGIDFTFGDYTLAADDYAVLVKNQAAFAQRYDTSGINIIPGSYQGYLDNDGEEIVLRDAVGTEIHDFDYNDGWYELTDGVGYSLTMVDPNSTDPNLWDAKYGWRSSLYVDGTPGRAPETVLAADSIVINEVLAHSHQTDPDWIELYNTTNSPIDISGWFLSDDDSSDTNIRKYEFQADTVIPANGYLTLYQDVTFGNVTAAGCHIPFGLSEGGETVYLYSGAGGAVTGFYQTQQKFDASETDVTFGRYEKTELSGGYDFVRQSTPTPGFVNSGPLIPDIVITEIYYNPPTGVDDEFVELYNRTGSSFTLETSVTTETSPGNFTTEQIPWRLEGTGYEFPSGVKIPAHTRILIAKNPAMYSSAPCAVYGPYDGKLDNGGEEIEIQIPGDQEYGRSRYWIPIEKIDYDDAAPWPTSADGAGDSLQRMNNNAYSRDYSNWNAANPTPGS